MHIVICISSMGQGGAERIASIMANYWIEHEKKVSIVTLAAEDVASAYPLHENVGLYNLDMSRQSEGISDKLLGNWGRVTGVRKQLYKLQPDVVVSFMDTMNVVVLLATLGLNLPVIVTEHCHPEQFPVGKMWGALRKLLYPRAAVLVVLGEEIRSWFARHLNARQLEIIHNPVIISSAVDPQVSGGSNVVIAAGRLAEEKRFEMLIEAFALVASDNPDWSLVIYGEGPDRDMLEGLIQEKSLASRVQLPGWVDDVHARMLDADIFAMSSRSEAFPGALCEAMACGLAVVSFDCPSGPGEIIRNDVDGMLVPTGDVEALSVQLNALMNDGPLRKRYGARAVEVVERFSLERIMEKWESVLTGIVK